MPLMERRRAELPRQREALRTWRFTFKLPANLRTEYGFVARLLNHFQAVGLLLHDDSGLGTLKAL